MIDREAIYKGATRPAMKFGIPLVPLVAAVGAAMLAIIWSGLLVSWWVAAAVVAVLLPTLAWMRLATHLDDQRFRQLALAARLRLHDHNRRFWVARSYSPTVYQGARDAWHA